ncbi:MAG: hypothetical protein ACREC1_06720 [Methylovirgula sp.]
MAAFIHRQSSDKRLANLSHFCGTCSNSDPDGLALAAQRDYEQDISERMAGGVPTIAGLAEKIRFAPPCQAFDLGVFWSFEVCPRVEFASALVLRAAEGLYSSSWR